MSSILTNGRAWGQEKSPGFVITNAFGGVLDEKLVAEKYLRASGLEYTIVRPGGLKSKPPTGALRVSGEDTLNSGEVSRDLVADVAVAALSDPKVCEEGVFFGCACTAPVPVPVPVHTCTCIRVYMHTRMSPPPPPAPNLPPFPSSHSPSLTSSPPLRCPTR